MATAGSRAAAAVAHDAGKPVWLVAGVGRVLPARVWKALTDRLDDLADPWDLDEEVVPLSLVDAVIGPNGSHAPAELMLALRLPDRARALQARHHLTGATMHRPTEHLEAPRAQP